MELPDHRAPSLSPLAHALLRLCRGWGALEREAVCCRRVTVPQCLALLELLASEEGGEALDVSGLATFLGATVSATTRLVDGLEARGWAHRTRALDDRRRVTLALAPAGHEEARGLAAQADMLVTQVAAQVPPAELPGVLRALRLLGDGLKAVGAGEAACCAPSPEGS